MPAIRFRFCAIAVACCVAACSDNNNVIPTNVVADTIDAGHARGDVIAVHASNELAGDDYLIVIGKTASILSAFNDGELAQSDFAAQVVSSEGVDQFANHLVVSYDDANAALAPVLRVYGVSFLPSSTASDVTAQYNTGLADLRATPPEDIDLAYIELQVLNLAAAQIMLQELSLQVGPGAMNDYIVTSQNLVDDQLDDATMLMNSFFF